MGNGTETFPLEPRITPVNQPYYEGMREGILLACRCGSCRFLFLPPSPYCPKCLGNAIEWEKISGNGTLYSFVEYHHLYNTDFSDNLPYIVAIVQLEEGPRLISNIIGAAFEDLYIGAPLKAVFGQKKGRPIVQFQIV